MPIKKIDLGDVAQALDQIARWTQAVQAELGTYKKNANNPPALMDELIQAVVSAVDSTAHAAAKANVLDATLANYAVTPTGKFDLETKRHQAGDKVKVFVQGTQAVADPLTGELAGAVLGRGC
jgi:hypothetical protein